MANLSLAFDILARDKNASKTFREVGDAAESAGKKGGGFGSSISGGLKVAAGAIAAAGIGSAFTGFVKDAAESAKISRLTEAAIKSTGGAANLTAAQVGDLATSLSNKSGVDDELIQSSNNVLLTFTKVRNEAGKGNDIFNQGAEAALNMSTALGTDLQGATTMIGKALNDPVAGITAMTRAGVQFTDQQKEQIKTLVESGDTLGAQKIILGELETQFGGAAAAAADPMQRLQTIMGNLGEKVGGAVLPVVENFATFIGDKLIPGAEQLFDVLFKGDFTEGPFSEDSKVVDVAFKIRDGFILVKDIAGQVFDILFRGDFKGGPLAEDSKVVDVLFKIRDGFITAKDVAKQAFDILFRGDFSSGPLSEDSALVNGLFIVREKFIELVDFVKTEVIPRFLEFGGYIRDEVIPKIQSLAEWIGKNKDFFIPFIAAIGAGVVIFQTVVAITKAWAAVQAVLNAVMAMNPIGLVIVVIAALVAALVMVYQRSEAFRDIVDGAWAKIREAVATAWEGYIKPAFEAIAGFVTGTLIPAIQWLWKNVIVPAFEGIAKVIGWAWNNVIKPLFEAWWGYITNVLIPVISWLWENVVKPVFGAIGDAISDAWNNVIKPAFDGLAGIIETIYDRFTTAKDNFGKFIDKLKGFTLPDWLQRLVDFVKSIGDGIGGAAGKVASFFGIGDAPANFRGTVLGGGAALARVRSMLPAGLAISSTYRSPGQNAAVGGHPTSLHMDRANPAVDIAGPTALLDRFAERLAAVGGWRQLLWRTPGHFDHIHVAHNGGTVNPGWLRMPGDRWDERTVRTQIGERILSRAEVAAAERATPGPVDLSDYSIDRLATAILAGADAVSYRNVRTALRNPGGR